MDETTEPTPAPDAPVETPAWVEILAHWRETIPVFQKFLPLSLSTKERMIEAGMLNSDDAHEAIRQHVRSDPYLKNVLAQKYRYDLDGTQSNIKIEYDQKVFAHKMLRGKVDRFKRTKSPKKQNTDPNPTPSQSPLPELTMQTKHIKLTFVVTDFDKHLGVDTTGKSTVPVLFETSGGKLKANLNPKSFRKAQATYREHNGSVAVVISGELDLANKAITGAGILVQVREKKASAEPAAAVAEKTQAPAAPVASVAPAKPKAPAPATAKATAKTPAPATTAPVVVVKKKRVVLPAA